MYIGQKHYHTKLEQPECPHCMDGYIVKDANAEDIFFCNSCYRNVQIKKFTGYRKK